jgi:crotonobetainyl-CoA:carnitine CoA-transferase CaiB-like acyl-CoA transferase
MILADHGAEVIAIEDRRFEGDGLFFDLLNRNKKHLSLNLKTFEGKAIFDQLAQNADVIIEGFRPGVVQRLGVDYESVFQKNPRIIYCSISGYGQDGPRSSEAGHDVNYLSSAGVLDLIGPRDGSPLIPGIQIGDICGSMNAVIGILLALQARLTSARGQYIDISMTDGLLGLLNLPVLLQRQSGRELRRSDHLLSHRYACYHVYNTADNGHMAVGALENRFWKQLCNLLEVPGFSELQYDEQRREELISALAAIFKTRSAAQWEELLRGHDVCCSRVLSIGEVMQQPLFKEREMIVDWQQPDGSKAKMFGIPVKLSETPGAIRTGPATFGQHNVEILTGLGYSRAEIDDFGARKII